MEGVRADRVEASVVVLAWGKRRVTEVCLESLRRALGDRLGESWELVLVDNASPDDTLELFEAWQDRAVVLALPDNRNYAGGNNAGAAVASGEVVIFLNNDTEVPPGALERLAEEARQEGTGVAGCRLHYTDGRLQHGGFGFRRGASGAMHPFHYFHYEPGNVPQAGAIYETDVVTGACLAIRRDRFIALGGFDTGFANGWEDVDFCFRVREKGHRVVYRGDSAVVHHEGLTLRRSHDASGNRKRFEERWGRALDDCGARIRDAFGARFNPLADVDAAGPPRPDGSRVSVEGLVRSAGPDGDEARALIAVLTDGGEQPAAREWLPAWITPALDEDLEAAVTTAQVQPKRPDAFVVQVPPGGVPVSCGSPSVLRIAGVPEGRALRLPYAAWVPSTRVADGLRDAGFPAGGVHLLPPPVTVEPGPGGGGLLAILPAHDLPLAEATARAIARLDGVLPVRVGWTVFTPDNEALVREWLPGASVETRAMTERTVSELVPCADVVVHLDPAAPWERYALIAAAGGAAVVADGGEGAGGGGIAAEILGGALRAPDAGLRDADRDGLADAVERSLREALESAADRDARSRLVLDQCGPGAIAGRLRSLVEDAAERRAVRRLVPAGAPAGPRTVLFWHPEIPDPDRSSGHRRAFEMLSALARTGCRPTLYTHESIPDGGDPFDRRDAVRLLEDAGVEVVAADRPGADEDAMLHRGFSLAIVSFWDLARVAIPKIRAISPSTRIAVDSVDIHFRRRLREAKLLGDAALLEEIETLRRDELAAYSLGDLVLAVSDEEQAMLCEDLSGVPVAVVPNIHHVDADAPGPAGRSGALFVGGFDHPPNADAVRFLCGEVLPALRARGYDESVAIAGSRMPDDLARLAREAGADVLGFIPSVEDELSRRRASLAPLRFGAGLKGKVGEALAAGVPVVGTPVAAEGFPDPESGMLIGLTADEIADALVRLSRDDALWSRLSSGGREMVERHFGASRCERELSEILEYLFAPATAASRS